MLFKKRFNRVVIVIPGAPVIGVATQISSQTAQVAFTAPQFNGGSPIISYTAVASPGNVTATITQAGSGTITLTGLNNGTTYTFTVYATNNVGNSPASAASNSVIPYTFPSAPVLGTATATGNYTASVPFTPPVSNGGAVITKYTAVSSPGNITLTLNQATGGSFSFTGLSDGTNYTFTVYATNARGDGTTATSNQITTPLLLDGSTSARANTSAAAIKALTGTNTDGIYYINLPTVGATPIYCIMNSSASGGGWMMAMKATRGTTFNWSSSHWNSVTTLNTGSNDRSDADAKFNTMNYFPATNIMALWPDIGTNGGGLGSNPYGCWSWLQNNFYGGSSTTLINFFNTAGSFNGGDVNTANSYGGYFIQEAKSWSGWANGVFSSQADIRFYGFNYKNIQSYGTRAYCRWGFGWNENGEGAYSSPGSMTGGGAPGSDDVAGGIGMDSNFSNYSAGDQINCCQDTTGINRSARVEIYIK
jgi:hypothetical protein